MPRLALGMGVAALTGLLVLGSGVARAAAERAGTREYTGQSRPHIVIHPRHRYLSPSAKRHCRFWLAKEYRLSGPVITPQMRCWWR